MKVDFASWIREASKGDVTDDWIADLATTLAESGETITCRNDTADIPSTGGPSSLSTLLSPLFLRAAGRIVPKLAVPGRPAGGLDVLAQIEGYRTTLSHEAIDAVLADCGYAHFDAGSRFAPLDREFFYYRQENGAQALWPLVVASLLSKKIAASVSVVGLDVRVAPHGNFGGDFAAARRHAARFVAAASTVGITAHCFLSDARRPYQPFIGRGEALWALSLVFDGTEGAWLARHVEECRYMAAETTANRTSVARSALERHFFANVEAQGGSRRAFDRSVAATAAAHEPALFATTQGSLQVDLGELRSAVVAFQNSSAGAAAEYPDLAGLVLLAAPDTFVEKGAPILSVRCPPERRQDFVARLNSAVRILPPRGEDSVETIHA